MPHDVGTTSSLNLLEVNYNWTEDLVSFAKLELELFPAGKYDVYSPVVNRKDKKDRHEVISAEYFSSLFSRLIALAFDNLLGSSGNYVINAQQNNNIYRAVLLAVLQRSSTNIQTEINNKALFHQLI